MYGKWAAAHFLVNVLLLSFADKIPSSSEENAEADNDHNLMPETGINQESSFGPSSVIIIALIVLLAMVVCSACAIAWCVIKKRRTPSTLQLHTSSPNTLTSSSDNAARSENLGHTCTLEALSTIHVDRGSSKDTLPVYEDIILAPPPSYQEVMTAKSPQQYIQSTTI